MRVISAYYKERKLALVRFSGPLSQVLLQLCEGDTENEAGGMPQITVPTVPDRYIASHHFTEFRS